MVELMSLSGYFSYKKITFRLSHSSANRSGEDERWWAPFNITSISFTMEVANNNRLPFIGMELIKIGKQLKTCVYCKTTNKGLLLHYQSHVDARYKRSLFIGNIKKNKGK